MMKHSKGALRGSTPGGERQYSKGCQARLAKSSGCDIKECGVPEGRNGQVIIATADSTAGTPGLTWRCGEMCSMLADAGAKRN